MGGGSAVVEEEAAVGRYPWEKSAVAESFALQTGGRSGPDDAFEFVITDADGNERVLGHRAWNTFYKQKHKPVSTNPNLQAVVAARSSMLSRATRGDWDSRLITMPMVLARAIAERKATMQQNLQLQRFIQKRALKLGQNYNKMFVCNKANNAQVPSHCPFDPTQSLLSSHYSPSLRWECHRRSHPRWQSLRKHPQYQTLSPALVRFATPAGQLGVLAACRSALAATAERFATTFSGRCRRQQQYLNPTPPLHHASRHYRPSAHQHPLHEHSANEAAADCAAKAARHAGRHRPRPGC